jgi:hypothetical protein
MENFLPIGDGRPRVGMAGKHDLQGASTANTAATLAGSRWISRSKEQRALMIRSFEAGTTGE